MAGPAHDGDSYADAVILEGENTLLRVQGACASVFERRNVLQA